MVNVLAIAPSAPGLVYAGTDGGVYLSRDDGARWQPASKGLPDDPAITALAISRDPNVVFAGTHSGVYRTRDGGANWTVADPRLAGQYILSLLIDPQTPRVIYAGTTTTVFRSDDDGQTWNDVGKDLQSVRVWLLAIPADGAAIYAVTDTGIHVSRDRGVRWEASSGGLPEGARPQSIAVTSRGLLAGTTRGLFHSKDAKSWTANSTLGQAFVSLLIADPRQSDRVFALTGSGIIQSLDGGMAWTPVANPPNHAPILSLLPGEKDALYVGTARGIWKTNDDGKSWASLNHGLIGTSVHTLFLISGSSSTLLAATRFGLALSKDRGSTWKEANGLADPFVLSLGVDSNNAKIVYAGTWNGSLFISRDGGENFVLLAENLVRLRENAPLSSVAVLHPSEKSTVLYVGTLGNGLFKSSDGGQKWTEERLGEVTRVTALTFISPWLYAGTERGVYRLDTSNVNASWQVASATLPVDETVAVIADPNRQQTLLAGFATNGLYRSDDGGMQWRQLGKGILDVPVRLQSLALSPGTPDLIYVATNRGVYRSEDRGSTWPSSNNGLPNVGVLALVVDPQAPENVFAGTNGNGVVRGIDQSKVTMPPWLMYGAAGGLIVALLGAAVLGWRWHWSAGAQERVWVRDWTHWQSVITQALWASGEVSETNLSKLPPRQRARALQRYVEQNPDVALSMQTSPIALRFDNYATALKLLSNWKAAWETVENEEAFRSVTSQIVDQLCTLLGFARVEERIYRGVIGYVVKAPALRLKIPPRFPIILIQRHEPQEEDVEALRDLMGILDTVSYFALVFDLRDPKGPTLKSPRSLKRLVRETVQDFIVLDGADMRSLLAARDHARRLVDLILEQVDLTVISPYVTSGPVPANMFFGREYELKTIVRTVRDTNFAIVGGRKVGKTSVLARVHQLLQEAPEYQPMYLDCQAVHSHGDFFEAIATMWKLPLPSPTPEGFRRVATELIEQYPGRTIVLLLDEVDGLLAHDLVQGERLFQIMRALAQERRLRFVFCGEKVLNVALHDPRLVFFNFCNLLPLSYLSPDEARRAVIDPMHEMGIALEGDSALADKIVELTSGHPNIVQYVCQKLIERINQRHARLITRADLDALSQSTQFAEYLVEVSWGNTNALERLITLLMLDCPETTPNEIAEILRARGLRISAIQLESAFDDLCLYAILRCDGSKYTFAAQTFPKVLRRSQDVKGLTESYMEEIQKSNEPTDEPA